MERPRLSLQSGAQTSLFCASDAMPGKTCGLVVGLTGGVASGKSTVQTLFEGHGITVIDADIAAREVVEPGQPGLQQIIDLFGDSICLPDGTLNRAALRRRVFTDPPARKSLEAIVHPLVRERMRAQLAQADSRYAILSVPLLLESGQRDMVDRILVVDLPAEQQLARLMTRDACDADQARAILAAQTDRDTRLRAADDLIDNSGPPAALAPQVATLHHRYLELATAETSA